jgi:hypothetical protein
MEQPNWPELHRLNRIWRQWMDARSKFVTPAQTVTTLQYTSGETREAKREYRLMHADLLAEYLLEVAPVGTKAALDAADDAAHRAMDLWIREQMPTHARNSKRRRTIRQELAQVVMLALTALPEIDFARSREESLDSSDLPAMDNICSLATAMVDEAVQGFSYWMVYCHVLLDAIYAGIGVEVDADLRQCWLALARKHASEYMHQYPEELL